MDFQQQGFFITKIAPSSYCVLDPGGASFYLVEGEEICAVIDTGITLGKQILPIIRTLTSKPLILVITHAHNDHMYHMDEFDTVYMCHDELMMPEQVLRYHMRGKQLKLEETIPVKTGSVIDLGGDSLEICQVPGHTPGSIVVLSRKDHILFTGDAIGSGSGLWMQIDGCVSLEEYRESLRFLLRWLVERGGRMRFYGGHSDQPFHSRLITGWNPLSLGLLADLADMVDQVVEGKIVGIPSDARKTSSNLEPPLYASYGRAEMQYLASRIKRAK